MDENGKPETPTEIRAWAKAQRAQANADLRDGLDRASADHAAAVAVNDAELAVGLADSKARREAATVDLNEQLDAVKRERAAQKEARVAAKRAKAAAKADRKNARSTS